METVDMIIKRKVDDPVRQVTILSLAHTMYKVERSVDDGHGPADRRGSGEGRCPSLPTSSRS